MIYEPKAAQFVVTRQNGMNWTESDYREYEATRSLAAGGGNCKPSRGEEQESRLQRQCEQYLRSIGAWYLHLTEARGNREGIPDLIVSYKGQMFGVELKSRTGKLTKAQMNELAVMKANGAVVGVVRSLEEFQNILHSGVSNF